MLYVHDCKQNKCTLNKLNYPNIFIKSSMNWSKNLMYKDLIKLYLKLNQLNSSSNKLFQYLIVDQLLYIYKS